jgi:hypothetical protein
MAARKIYSLPRFALDGFPMRYGTPELLFNKHGMHAVLQGQEQSVLAAPASMNVEIILNTPVTTS